MLIVLLMSTDQDIQNTELADAWGAPDKRYAWNAVKPGGLDIPAGATLIVIAHGNGEEIGNSKPGSIDITASAFLALVYSNMADGSAPGAIYLSTCGPGIAQFAAAVKIAASQNKIWQKTAIYGHNDAAVGDVPSPKSMDWTRIF